MILLTGGTGFIGRALARQLVNSGQSVRLLISPSPRTPNLPLGVPVEVAVTSLTDTRGLLAAMREVDTVYHLAGAEHRGARARLLDVDVRGTQNMAEAARLAGVSHFFYVSHLGADRASAFPVLKAKGIAEEFIRRSGVPHTIFRTGILFGPEDHFTTMLARLIRSFPLMFAPAQEATQLQPLWVEDLVTCLTWSQAQVDVRNQTLEIGGSEYFTYRQILEILFNTLGRRRPVLPMSLPSLRALTVFLEYTYPRFPSSPFWIDYLSVNRICEIDALPRTFGFLPARFAYRLNHLKPDQGSLSVRPKFTHREHHV